MITLDDARLAQLVGKESCSAGKIFWLPEDLNKIKIALNTAQQFSSPDETFTIESLTMPHWLYLTIFDSLKNRIVAINDPEHGPVTIPRIAPKSKGAGLTWRIGEERDFFLVEFANIRRRVLPNQLEEFVPPEIASEKGVIIGGNAPPWLSTMIGISYEQIAPWVACTQKNGSAVVAISQDQSVKPGTVIGRQEVSVAHEKAALCSTPQRGDVWWFDDGYDPHPGLIISPAERNQRLNDVLLLPITSSSMRLCDRYLPLPSSPEGLLKDSFIQVENISKVPKRKLISGPVTKIEDEDLMRSVVDGLRSAIGDSAVSAY